MAVELEEGVEIEPIMNKIADALMWVEGTGEVEVDYIGLIELVPGVDGEEDDLTVLGPVMKES